MFPNQVSENQPQKQEKIKATATEEKETKPTELKKGRI